MGEGKRGGKTGHAPAGDVDAREEIVTRRLGGVQKTRRTRRKLFAGARVQTFLDHLAASCNVAASARAAGVTPECVYQRRARDPALRAAWQEAIEIGYIRLETELLRLAMGTPHPRADPTKVVAGGPGDDGFDKELAIILLREHRRVPTGARSAEPSQRRRGAAPTVAD